MTRPYLLPVIYVSLLIITYLHVISALEVAVSAQAQLEADAFSAYIDQFYPSGRSNEHSSMIEMITRGLKRRDVDLISLIQVAESLTAQTQSSVAISTGMTLESTSQSDDQRGPNGCLMYNGEECNGERAGTCIERTCHCVGQWTGIRCQSDWSIKRYNPYTGLSEANEECAGEAADFMKGC